MKNKTAPPEGGAASVQCVPFAGGNPSDGSPIITWLSRLRLDGVDWWIRSNSESLASRVNHH